jgi:hypothetical protein
MHKMAEICIPECHLNDKKIPIKKSGWQEALQRGQKGRPKKGQKTGTKERRELVPLAIGSNLNHVFIQFSLVAFINEQPR